MLTLKPINSGNWENAIQLSVNEEQKDFIATNLFSIAQLQFLDNFSAMGVYLDDKMVGFAMYGIDSDDQNYWIYRLMIDKEYQGKGLGSLAVLAIIEELKNRKKDDIPCIMIGYHPINDGARFTYKKAGFIEQEIAPWCEQLAKYDL